MLIDAHCHLQDPRFQLSTQDLVARARSAGVLRMVVAGCSERDWARVGELASLPELRVAYGLHPWYIKDRSLKWREALERCLLDPRASLGEAGLDLRRPALDRDDALHVLVEQLDLARRLERPVILHGVGAWGPLLELLRDRGGHDPGILLHSYGGGPELIAEYARMGAYFSFSGLLTRPRATRARASARMAPVDRILLESDAPDMMPELPSGVVPLQDAEGKLLSEPALLPRLIECLAAIREADQDSLEQQLALNAEKLWPGVLS